MNKPLDLWTVLFPDSVGTLRGLLSLYNGRTVASRRQRVHQAFIHAIEYVHLLNADLIVWLATPFIGDGQ